MRNSMPASRQLRHQQTTRTRVRKPRKRHIRRRAEPPKAIPPLPDIRHFEIQSWRMRKRRWNPLRGFHPTPYDHCAVRPSSTTIRQNACSPSRRQSTAAKTKIPPARAGFFSCSRSTASLASLASGAPGRALQQNLLIGLGRAPARRVCAGYRPSIRFGDRIAI